MVLCETGSGMETEVTTNGECKITLGLADTPETQAIWPHSFKLSLEITVGESLNLELITHNPTTHTFHVTQALHTYFKVGHIDQVAISGLEGIKYIDKTDNGLQKLQAGPVTIDTEVRLRPPDTNYIHREQNGGSVEPVGKNFS